MSLARALFEARPTSPLALRTSHLLCFSLSPSLRLHASALRHRLCVPAGEENEPEIRKQLRAARLAEKHAKMRQKLAEKLAMDEEEARRKEEQVQLKGQLQENIVAWKNKHRVSEREAGRQGGGARRFSRKALPAIQPSPGC